MTITIAQSKYDPVPTGEYPARISDIQADEGKFGPQVKFTFNLLGRDKTLTGWTSQKFSRQSKLFKWTARALNRSIRPNEAFNSDELLDREVRLQVVVKNRDDGSQFNAIHDLLPAENGHKQTTLSKTEGIPF